VLCERDADMRDFMIPMYISHPRFDVGPPLGSKSGLPSFDFQIHAGFLSYNK